MLQNSIKDTISGCCTNPCENGGTCYDLSGSITCKCAFGYEGDNCQIKGEPKMPIEAFLKKIYHWICFDFSQLKKKLY